MTVNLSASDWKSCPVPSHWGAQNVFYVFGLRDCCTQDGEIGGGSTEKSELGGSQNFMIIYLWNILAKFHVNLRDNVLLKIENDNLGVVQVRGSPGQKIPCVQMFMVKHPTATDIIRTTPLMWLQTESS